MSLYTSDNEAQPFVTHTTQIKKRILVVLFCVVLTSLAVLPFFVLGEDQRVGCCGGAMPVTHDSWMHFNQMQAFWKGLVAGRVYPRWDEQTHGYGAPTTSFYPPGAYYLTSFVYFIVRDWSLVWVGFYWLAMLASALTMYLCARQTMSEWASLVTTSVYVFAPYHLLNQYQRGALGEFLSFIWMPLLLLFAERVGKHCADESPVRSGQIEVRATDAAGLALSFAGFLWSHPPTAYQFCLVFGTGFVAWSVWRRQWGRVFWVGLSLVFGSLLAAAYLYPGILEQRLINAEDVEFTWPYHTSYVFDFSQTRYDHLKDGFIVRLDHIWAFNLAVIVAAVVVLRHSKPVIRWWGSGGILASFLMTKYSAPLGRHIPKIEIGVFSWRMLAITSLVVALLVGAMVDGGLRIGNWGRKALSVVIVLGTLLASVLYVAWPIWRGQAFEPNPQHYNYATLPRGVARELPTMGRVQERVQTASGRGQIVVKRWEPEFRELTVELEADDQLQFRTFDFAGWTALVDGQIVPIQQGQAKNIVVEVRAGKHRVTLDFRSTMVRRVSHWLTVLSFLSLVFVVFVRKRIV